MKKLRVLCSAIAICVWATALTRVYLYRRRRAALWAQIPAQQWEQVGAWLADPNREDILISDHACDAQNYWTTSNCIGEWKIINMSCWSTPVPLDAEQIVADVQAWLEGAE